MGGNVKRVQLVMLCVCLVVAGMVSSVKAGFEFTIEGGPMMPSGSLSGVSGAGSDSTTEVSIESGGMSVGTSLFYWFNKKFALGVEGIYAPSVEIKEKYSYQAGYPFGAIDLEGSSTEPMFAILPGIKFGSNAEPSKKEPSCYVLLSAGIYSRAQATNLTVEGSKTVGGYSTHISRTDVPGYSIDSVGFAPGFGVSFPIGSKVQLGFDVRYHIVSQDGIRFLNPTVHLAF